MRPKLILAFVATLAVAAPAGATPAGYADPTFSRDGAAFADLGGVEGGVAVASAPGGKVVVAGYTGRLDDKGRWSSLDIAVARFRADGRLDPTFSRDGKTKLNLGAFERASAVVVASDGSITLLATQTSSPTECCDSLLVVRLTVGGALDTAFGSGGTVKLDLLPVLDDDPAQHPASMIVQRDGKVVVGGTLSKTVTIPEHGDVRADKIVLVRLGRDGSRDLSFGIAGAAIVGRNARDRLAAITQTTEGSVLLAATSEGPRGNAITVTRLTPDGLPDPSFGLASEASMPAPAGAYLTATSIARDPAGSILVAGEYTRLCLFCAGSPFVARFASEGTPDARFGTAGIATLPIQARANGVGVVKGRVVIVTSDIGCFLFWCTSGPQVMRLTSNGGVDRRFGSQGSARIPEGFEYVNSMAIGGDRILLAGRGGTRRDCWFLECLFTRYVYDMNVGVARFVA